MPEITSVKQETYDVRTFCLDEKADFIPGQYCLVGIKEVEGKKPFTFSNKPSDFISFTVKETGDFTKKMFTLKAGDVLEITPPRGEALNFDKSIKEDIVMIAGGSGITPFISILRYAESENLENNFILLNSNRAKKDIIFHDKLEKLDGEKNISVVNTLTEEDWNGKTGYIDEKMIQKYVPNPKDKIFYISGPPAMTKAVKQTLARLGIENIRMEGWEINGKVRE